MTLRIVVVDDENLVRKWLVSEIRSSGLDVEVVGEAGSGEAALSFLAVNEADLLITDLGMPGMTGLELMKAAMETQPQLAVVVLTCHHEFDYIQESMRAGAIDYIVKTQLDNDQLSVLLEQIMARVRKKQAGSPQLNAASKQTSKDIPRKNVPDAEFAGWLLLSRIRRTPEVADLTIGLKDVFLQPGALYLEARMDRAREDLLVQRGSGPDSPFTVWRVQTPGRWSAAKIKEAIVAFIQEDWFLTRPESDATVRELMLADPTVHADRLADKQALWARIEEQWYKFNWIIHDQSYAALTDKISRAHALALPIKKMVYTTISGWTHFQAAAQAGWPNLMSQPNSWLHWQAALTTIRHDMRETLTATGHSEEIIGTILRVVHRLRMDPGELASQDRIAKEANISRGYFSTTFKEVTGKTFQDMLKAFKMDKAKSLLRFSSLPVYRIAEQAGFQDEKYFSREFKRSVGMLPSEYRAAYGSPADLEEDEGEMAFDLDRREG